MQTSNSSQCQLFQLHIDAYLDNELEQARAGELEEHVAHCEGCRRELAYARQLHEAVVSLPILDCSDAALEPVDRLFRAAQGVAGDTQAERTQDRQTAGGSRNTLSVLLDLVPVPWRVGVPALAALLLAIGLGRTLLVPDPAPQLAGQSEGQPQYTEAEIMKGLQDLELALDYLGQISARTEVLIEDRFLRQQLEDSINASFSTDARNGADEPVSNGPI